MTPSFHVTFPDIYICFCSEEYKHNALIHLHVLFHQTFIRHFIHKNVMYMNDSVLIIDLVNICYSTNARYWSCKFMMWKCTKQMIFVHNKMLYLYLYAPLVFVWSNVLKCLWATFMYWYETAYGNLAKYCPVLANGVNVLLHITSG